MGRAKHSQSLRGSTESPLHSRRRQASSASASARGPLEPADRRNCSRPRPPTAPLRTRQRGGVSRGGATARRRRVGAGYPWRSDAAGSCSCNGSASWRGPRLLAALAQLSGAPGLPRSAQGSGDSPGVGWRWGGRPGAPTGVAPHSPASLSLSFH